MKIDHLSVLRPKSKKKTTKKRQPAKSADGGVHDNPNDSEMLEVFNPETETHADSLNYSDDFANQHPLASSFNGLEMSRGSNALEQSGMSVSFRDHPVSALEESYNTAPLGGRKTPKNKLPPRPISASSKAFNIYSTMPNRKLATGEMIRPSTAGSIGGVGVGVITTKDQFFNQLRPTSAVTAPNAPSRTAELFFGDDLSPRKEGTENRRKSMVVGSITGLSRLREFEKIASDNKKIIKNMDGVVAYYNANDWEEDRREQIGRMKRNRKFPPKTPPNHAVTLQGMKEMGNFARTNSAMIEEWERNMEVRLKAEKLQSIGKGQSAETMKRKAKKKKNMIRRKERAKKEHMERKRMEREREEKEKVESERNLLDMVTTAKREMAARKGLATAASKFTKILVINEEKRRQTAKELFLIAQVAANEFLKVLKEDKLKAKAQRNGSFVKVKVPGQGHRTETENIKRVRNTLVQEHNDNMYKNLIRGGKGKKEKRKRERTATNDFLENALNLIAKSAHGEELEDDIDPDSPVLKSRSRMGDLGQDIVVGGDMPYSQPKIMDGVSRRVRSVTEGEVEVAGQLKFFDCVIDVAVVSEDEIEVVCEIKGMEGDEGVCRKMQKIPRLVVVERNSALEYGRNLVDRLFLEKRKRRVVRQGIERVEGWEDWELVKDEGNLLV